MPVLSHGAESVTRQADLLLIPRTYHKGRSDLELYAFPGVFALALSSAPHLLA